MSVCANFANAVFNFRVWKEKSDFMSNRQDEEIPLNVDENKNAILEKGLSGSQQSVGTWAEWDKESVYLLTNLKKKELEDRVN